MKREPNLLDAFISRWAREIPMDFEPSVILAPGINNRAWAAFSRQGHRLASGIGQRDGAAPQILAALGWAKREGHRGILLLVDTPDLALQVRGLKPTRSPKLLAVRHLLSAVGGRAIWSPEGIEILALAGKHPQQQTIDRLLQLHRRKAEPSAWDILDRARQTPVKPQTSDEPQEV